MIPDVTDGGAYLEPLEGFCRFSLLQRHLFGANLGVPLNNVYCFGGAYQGAIVQRLILCLINLQKLRLFYILEISSSVGNVNSFFL